MKRTLALGASITLGLGLLALAVPTFASSVISNGSFASGIAPGTYTTLSAGDSTSVTSWTVDSGSVDFVGSYWQPSDAPNSIDLNGLAAGSISQTFATTPGAMYQVTFDLSGNPDSSSDSNLASPSLKDVQVNATGGSPQDFTFDTSSVGNSLANMLWQSKTYTFTATSNSTTLTFASQTAGAFGPALDNVTVTEVASQPVQCPAGTTQGSVVDTFTVNSQSSTATQSNISLTNGQAYVTTVSGTWQNSNINAADAEYASTDSWVTSMDGWIGAPYFLGASEFDLEVNGSFINWGAYNASHTYSTILTGTGSTAGFLIFDGDSNAGPSATNSGWYGDNSGSLTVSISPCNSNQVRVRIFKYVDGVQATAANTNSATFPMETTFSSPNLGNVTNVPFTLSPTPWGGIGDPYEADFVGSVAPATYEADEMLNTPVVGASCDGSHTYALEGYSTGNTLAQAQNKTNFSTTPPTFSNLQDENNYMIVWNHKCGTPPQSQVPTSKNQCMNNGWKTLVDTNGRSFKNQGDCVSFVATKGKNTAAGN